MDLRSDFEEILLNIPERNQKNVELKKDTPELGDEVKMTENENVAKGVNVNAGVIIEEQSSRKRKRDCYSSMLNWIHNVAKNPCNPAIGSLPESNKWKFYGDEHMWKQVLSVRGEMVAERNTDANTQQSIWQKIQKMHPSIYETERLRYSRRLISANNPSKKLRECPGSDSSSSDYKSDENAPDDKSESLDSISFLGESKCRKKTRFGPQFQAEVPNFEIVPYESDSKWLGTRFWPLEKEEKNLNLIERDPIGKGRQESCGCEFPGSIECVRFHIREKKMKLKLELGSSYNKWKFDCMGEEVSLSWSQEDEKNFENIVNSNRLSSDKYYWVELFKFFPRKGRENLVSYYFNVFLLRQRGVQNRSSKSEIYSDDEDSEYGPVGNRFGEMGSIFCSPKKPNLDSR